MANNLMRVRHRLLTELIKLWKNNKLTGEDIDRLPLQLSPKHSKHAGRCCVHKERAVGEVMSIGKTYKEAFQKAIRSLV